MVTIEQMHIVGIEVVEAMKDRLTKEHGKASGALQSSVTYRIEGSDIIISMEDYAEYLEYGTPPHMPPVDEIENWVKVKFGLTGDKGRQVAWAVAMHIKKFGTRPFPFIRTTLREDLPKILKSAGL